MRIQLALLALSAAWLAAPVRAEPLKATMVTPAPWELELKSIRAAQSAVADMKRLASTQAERQLAAETEQYVDRRAGLARDRASARKALAEATRRLEEAQREIDQQRFQIQGLMQQFSQSQSLVSNIMKTKHDTAMAAIQNIR